MDERISRAVTFITDNLNRNLTRSQLARDVGLSVSAFAHLFKSEMGTPPAQYITDLKIMRGKELLQLTTLSIKEVGAMLGFSESHFDRIFKRHVQLTPLQYRALRQR